VAQVESIQSKMTWLMSAMMHVATYVHSPAGACGRWRNLGSITGSKETFARPLSTNKKALLLLSRAAVFVYEIQPF
jgi:hypothetical protein